MVDGPRPDPTGIEPRLTRRPLRVLAISHTAVTRNGRLRYERLAASRPDLKLTLVVPDRWREYGADVAVDASVDAPAGGLDLRARPIRLLDLPRIGWYAHHYKRLAELFDEIRPNVIQLWEEPWSLVALQAIRLRDRILPDAAVILETDQNIHRRLPGPFERIRRYTLGRTDLLIGRQPESLEVARACGYRGPTAIVEYGVSDLFHGTGREAARAALGLSGFSLGYIGRLVADKGLDDLLDALAACDPAVNLLVVGDGPHRTAFETHARSVGVWHRIRMHPAMPIERVAGMMGALDALVLVSRTMPTWKEQFGRVIMEAQACGVPVIGSDSGAIPWVVGPGGWIVPERDPAALAELITRLCRDPDDVARARQAGLDQAARRFSSATIAHDLGEAIVAASLARRSIAARSRTAGLQPAI